VGLPPRGRTRPQPTRARAAPTRSLPPGLPPLRTRLDHRHLKSRLRAMGHRIASRRPRSTQPNQRPHPNGALFDWANPAHRPRDTQPLVHFSAPESACAFRRSLTTSRGDEFSMVCQSLRR
jgi:hypothetical protein